MRPLVAVVCAAIALAGCGGGGDVVTTPSGPAPLPDKFAYDASQPLHATVRPLGGIFGSRSRAVGLKVQSVTYDAVDHQRVPALFVRPPYTKPPYPCVIFENGLGSAKEQSFIAWAPLASLGMATFAIDARYHGARMHRPLDWLRAARSPVLLERMIRGTVLDLRRAVDYLDSRSECDPDRIGYVGISLTAIIGTLLAGVDSRIQAPALVVGGGDWTEILRGNNPLLQRVKRNRDKLRAALARLAPLDPIRYAAHISPRPVLFINGRQDQTVPPPAARALHNAARQPKTVYWYTGGHNAFFGVATQKITDELLNWLQDHLLSPPLG